MTPLQTLAIVFYGLIFPAALAARIVKDREWKCALVGAASAFLVCGIMTMVVSWVTK